MLTKNFKVQGEETNPGARAAKLAEPMWTPFFELHTGPWQWRRARRATPGDGLRKAWPRGSAVQDLKLGLRVEQTIERLQDQRLEYHNRVERRGSPLLPSERCRAASAGLEWIEVHQAAQLHQRISRSRQAA
jgi:hypothetical protein